MGSLGWPEILIILVIALIIFGPRKLPELGKTLGQSLAQFRRASEDFKHTWEQEVELEKQKLDAPPPATVDYSSATNPYEGQDFSLDGSHAGSGEGASSDAEVTGGESPETDLGVTAPAFVAEMPAHSDPGREEASASPSETEAEGIHTLDHIASVSTEPGPAPVEATHTSEAKQDRV